MNYLMFQQLLIYSQSPNSNCNMMYLLHLHINLLLHLFLYHSYQKLFYFHFGIFHHIVLQLIFLPCDELLFFQFFFRFFQQYNCQNVQVLLHLLNLNYSLFFLSFPICEFYFHFLCHNYFFFFIHNDDLLIKNNTGSFFIFLPVFKNHKNKFLVLNY